jgi:tRNA (adenine57-N1/adenine58-N1)-methyltransferase
MDKQKLLDRIIQAGDLVQLVGPRDKSLILRVDVGKQVHTHIGIIEHNNIIGKEWGTVVLSHLDKKFRILQPALDDLLRDIKRNTQIMYPKDIGYILINLGIGPGKKVAEAGTGSGAFTIALAHAVGPTGHVTSYEKRPEMSHLAKKNLENLGLGQNVSLIIRDIGEGIDEGDFYAFFLDLPNPEDYVSQLHSVLIPGGHFGAILPTTNQVSRLIPALEKNGFSFIEVSEILHRYYKPAGTRLRPTDKMVAHTGFLVFARVVNSATS